MREVHVEGADCPACGAAVAAGVSMCPAYKTALSWTDGVPALVRGGASHRRLVLLAAATLIVVGLAL